MLHGFWRSPLSQDRARAWTPSGASPATRTGLVEAEGTIALPDRSACQLVQTRAVKPVPVPPFPSRLVASDRPPRLIRGSPLR
jgi:hypothetical protein